MPAGAGSVGAVRGARCVARGGRSRAARRGRARLLLVRGFLPAEPQFSPFAVAEHAPRGAPQALPRSRFASLVMGGVGLSDWDRMEGALGSPPLQAPMRD